MRVQCFSGADPQALAAFRELDERLYPRRINAPPPPPPESATLFCVMDGDRVEAHAAASGRSSDSNQPRSPAGISGFTSAAAWAATRSPSMTQNSVADAGGGGDGGLTRCG